LPDASRSAALLDFLGQADARATLSRSVVEARPEGIYLYRESRGLPHSAAVQPGRIWDGRHRLAEAGAEDVQIAPFGREAAGAEAASTGLAPASLVRPALAAEPALWRGAECLGPAPTVPLAAPWASFLPSFDLAPAEAATELVGGRPFPRLPLVQ
jgi:tRNA(Ile)-lysidine synthase